MLQGLLKKRPQPEAPTPQPLAAGTAAEPVNPAVALEKPGEPGTVAKVAAGAPQVTPEMADAFAARMETTPPPPIPPEGTTGPRVFGINWERLGQEESVKRAVVDVNKTLAESGRTVMGEGARSVAQGGPGSKTLTSMLADAKDMGVTVEDVLRLPEIPKRVQSVEDIPAFTAGANAVHEVVFQSLRDTARLARGGDPAARGDLPTMIALANETTLKTKDLGTNLAQALNARKAQVAPIGEVSGTSMLQFQDTVARLAGMQDIDKAAEMIGALEKKPSVMRGFLDQVGTAAKTGQNILWELYVNDLLGPITLGKKLVGDSFRLGYEVLERSVAAVNPSGSPETVAYGEGVRFATAAARAIPSATAKMYRALMHGEIDLATGIGQESPFPKAISAEGVGLSSTNPFGRIVDAAGTIIRAPGTSVGILTDVAKAVNYEAEKAALSYRQAAFEGHEGAAFSTRVAYIEAHPAEFPQIEFGAKQAATINTFTNELGTFGTALTTTLNAAHLRSQATFLRVPINLEKFATQATFPFNVPSILWGEIGEGLKTPGPPRQRALARIELSAVTAATGAYLTTNGLLTGAEPSDPGLREARRSAGIKPYTLAGKIGLASLKPVGTMFGLTATFVEAMAQIPADSSWFQKGLDTAAALVLSWGAVIKDASYFTGIKNVLEGIQHADRMVEPFVTQLARSLAPATLRQTNQAYFDNVMRSTHTALEAFLAAVPGYSTTLAAHRDELDGKPFEYPAALGPDIASPVKIYAPQHDIVRDEMIDQQIRLRATPWSIGGPPEPMIQMTEGPPKGVPLDSYQRERWVVLKTQDVRIGGKTQFEALEHLISSPKYQLLPAGPESDARQNEWDMVRRAYSDKARQQLLREDPALAAQVGAQRRERLTNQLPVTNPKSTGTPTDMLGTILKSLGR